jgi:hypothetical protein
MFVLSQNGEVFVYRIKEIVPKREDIELFGQKAGSKIKGELMVQDDPVRVKGIGPIK